MLSRASAVGEMSVSELADLMAMDRTTLGRNLQPLEREGLVQLNVGEDRRERLVSVTPAGRRVLARALPLWEEVHQRFENKIGKREAKELRDALKRIVNVGRELSAENATRSE